MIKFMLLMIFGSVVLKTVCANSEVSCGKNSKPGCGQNCGKRCTDYPPGSTRVSFICSDICNLNGCDCDPGFVYDNYTKSCVEPNHCKVKAVECKGENEVYEICPAKCPFRVCGIDDRLIDCAPSPQIGDANCAPPACNCRNGYYRNNKGKCVKFENCPKCDKKPNEIYDPCIAPCPPRRCDVDERIIRCAAPPVLGDAACKAGCRCTDGYKRDNGTCIPQDQCQPFCGENEEPSDCVNGGCFSARYCSQKGRPEICVNLIEGACKKGCLCKKGYLRDEMSGLCVLEDKCPATPRCEGVNQVYDYCPVQCPPRDCSVNGALIKCAAPPSLGDPECKPGCRCADGFKIENGTCIPENQCKSFCGENEESSDCINGGCFDARYCSQKGRPFICVDLIEGACKKGCLCKEGYLRDEMSGRCVPKDQCPVTPKCEGINQVYDYCPVQCPPRDCSVNGALIKCAAPPSLGDPECKPGCRCADGFKIENGTCIPENQCKSFCGENEESSDCINGGCFDARYCSQKGRPFICVDLIEGACKKGCLCKEGYLRDEMSGRCVPKDQCPVTPKCEGVNQVYDYCPVQCPPRDCSVNGALIKCAAPPVLGDPECKPGCRCTEGFKTENGICIPENQCKPFCTENEVPSNCTNGGCYGAKYCSQKGAPIKCVKLRPESCVKGCLCKKGYLRNEFSGICVKEDECPETPECEAPNTVFEYCPALCPPRRCDVNDALILCITPPQLGDPECEPSCQCKEGYKTNSEGICVPVDQCPPFCGPNEEPSNCTNGGCWSARNCSEIGEPIKCTKIPEGSCIKGCLCKDPLLRNDETGECVLQSECPNVNQTCTEPNQVYDTCFSPSCPPRRCDVDERLIKCAPPKPGDSNCVSGCRCADGHKKDANGMCIPQEQCPPFCGPNEEPSNCVNGGCWTARYCSERGDPEKCALPEQFCTKGCLCKEGRLRNDETGECVLEKECPPKGENKCNLPNEVYVLCPGCSPQTCETANKTYNCPISPSPSIVCRGTCQCKPGFFRNKIGECISKENCFKCTGPHEYYSCGGACDNVCATLREQNQTSCPIINVKCNEKCYCESGYARDKNNVCIPIKDCPPPKVENKCNLQNEVYVLCPGCSPQTCETANKTYNCPISTSPSRVCRGACQCKPGFFRNKIGQCISKENCLKCTGPHEFYSCGGACDNVCATLSKQNQTSCPIINIKCNEKCYCENGYARDKNNVCIPIKDCPPPKKTCPKPKPPPGKETCTGPNEKYDRCAPQCSPQSCSSLVGPRPQCLPIAPGQCLGACRCTEGYYRDDNRTCIPKEQCQLCTRKNEVYNECSSACSSDTCASLYEDNSDCVGIALCIPACQCEKGYKRNEDGDCIPISECPCKVGDDFVADDGCNTCSCVDGKRGSAICSASFAPCDLKETCTGPNEKYDPCAPQCSPQSCSSLVGPRPQCLPIAPGQCFGACRCIEGYYRDDNRTCIPKEQCQLCTGKNEVYNNCTNACSSDTCASLYEDNSDCVGIALCIPACQCEKDYKRNEDGDCIPISECPCKIGASYKSEDGCNTCYCQTGQKGDSPCTEMACKSGPEVPVGPESPEGLKVTAEVEKEKTTA